MTTPGGTATNPANFTVNSTGTNTIDNASMVWVPGGSFTMGTTYGYVWWNAPYTQQVTLTGYWIYANEVTVAQYLAFCAATGYPQPPWPGSDGSIGGYSWAGKSGWNDPTLQQSPIVDVSWNDAQAYAKWAGVSLPSEAQYEYAARGTQENNYPWGGTATAADPYNDWDITRMANWCNSMEENISTWPVGSFPAGASWCGAQDLAGNVWEWCADYYGNYSSTPVTNPTGPATGGCRVTRGGAWDDGNAPDFRGAYRTNGCYPNYWNSNLGFRCVSHATPPRTAIASFTPCSGGPGTVVTITGANFTGATAVVIGGTPAASFTVVSPFTITATLANGATGTISVTTPGGTTSSTGAFSYLANPTPSITSFSPSCGGAGKVVTITGANFVGTTTVSFGGTAAASFTVVNVTTITATVGSGATGTISVTTPGGTATSNACFHRRRRTRRLVDVPSRSPAQRAQSVHRPCLARAAVGVSHRGRSFAPPRRIGADGTIYVGRMDGNLYAINPNGTQQWAFATGGRSSRPRPSGRTAPSTSGRLMTICMPSTRTARSSGHFPPGDRSNSSPAIGADGTIYVGSWMTTSMPSTRMARSSGRFPPAIAIYSSPAIGADGTIYVGSDDNNLYAVNPNGTLQWAFPTGGYVALLPGPRRGRHHLRRLNDDNLYAINPNGTLQWAFPTGDEIYFLPGDRDGRHHLRGSWMTGSMPSTRTARKGGRFPPGR